MHQTQVQYWTLQEQKRSNQAKEAETARHNLATETQASSELTETSQHNRATEGVDLRRVTETERSNRANEDLQRVNLALTARSIDETKRHNTATERQALMNANITQTANELVHEASMANANAAETRARANALAAMLQDATRNAELSTTQKKNLSEFYVKLEQLAQDERQFNATEARRWTEDVVNTVTNILRIINSSPTTPTSSASWKGDHYE